ncbi:MAG: cation transporter [Lysobacteraceae bacterium]|nr:MAG: cation transporter [Xanthomonadaceae bacterium]
MITVLVLLGITLVLFVSEVVRIDIAALLILVAVGLLDLVPKNQLFEGLASNAVVSIIAVMILGAGLDRTGVMGSVAAFIMRVGGSTETRILPLISGTVGVISSFMQNVGATALFLPVVSRIASRARLQLSRLLMPMGFCAILGGTVTMVGSSPLILLNDLLEASNRQLPPGVDTMQPFSLFSVTPIGLMLLASGIIYFLLFGWLVLPKAEEGTADASVAGGAKDYFTRVYGIKGDICELVVTADSPLVGMTVGEVEADETSPFILGIRNGDETRLAPGADQMFWVGTVVAAMGPKNEVREWARVKELTYRVRLRDFSALVKKARAGIVEAVIPPGSPLVGQTLVDVQPRRRYGINPLAINRQEEIIRHDMRDMELEVGDTLVFFGNWRDLAEVDGNRDFVIVTDFPREEQRPQKVGFALLFFMLAMGLILFSDLPLSLSLLTGALGMVVTNVLSMDEAYAAVSWKTVFLLASLIPLGGAMETTGTAAWVAQEVLGHTGGMPEWVMLLLLGSMATFFTLVMSNVGATVLLVPLAINIALATDADPAMYAMTIAIATSNAFLIPTHQVNALIMGPGGYKVIDFLRVGGLMTVIFLAVLVFGMQYVF